MEELVSYILERGHRKIAYIHGEDSSVTRNRLGSFYRTLQKNESIYLMNICQSFLIEMQKLQQ